MWSHILYNEVILYSIQFTFSTFLLILYHVDIAVIVFENITFHDCVTVYYIDILYFFNLSLIFHNFFQIVNIQNNAIVEHCYSPTLDNSYDSPPPTPKLGIVF